MIGIAPRGSKATARAMLNFAMALGARTRQEVYLSTPITTGDTYVRWRQETAHSIGRDDPRYNELHREKVINHNIAQAAPLAERLRAEFPDRIVVNPADMADIEDWTQADYHDFWCAVIRRFAGIVIFADGWQFSHGCVTEFATAVECGAQLLTQNMAPLTSDVGSALVARAMAELDGLSEDTDPLRKALARLDRRRS